MSLYVVDYLKHEGYWPNDKRKFVPYQEVFKNDSDAINRYYELHTIASNERRGRAYGSPTLDGETVAAVCYTIRKRYKEDGDSWFKHKNFVERANFQVEGDLSRYYWFHSRWVYRRNSYELLPAQCSSILLHEIPKNELEEINRYFTVLYINPPEGFHDHHKERGQA